jgi:hypothetical protein
MEDERRSTPGSAEWLALQTRLTTFHTEGADAPDLVSWWQEAFGSEPERAESRHTEQSFQVSGPLAGNQLTVDSSPGRTDFVLEPGGVPVRTINADWSVPSTGLHYEATGAMVEPVGHWLKTGAPVHRLALGALLLMPSKDLISVYRLLSNFLPGINLDGVSTPDFLFRVNRPRNSRRRPDTIINRLAAWSTAHGQSITIGADQRQLTTGPVQYAAHLELDINTQTRRETSFRPEISFELLQELIELATEIAEQGDKA